MNIADNIALLCFDKYHALGKTGKPVNGKEWTLLSGIISELDGKLDLVSLATGTKCIGIKSMRTDGTIVNDSHAEVLARRGFLRFLYEEMKNIKTGGCSNVLESSGQRFRVKQGLKWHLFTSWVPCGDASIIPMEEIPEPAPKRQRLDIHRTGAKPVVGEDPRLPGIDYHQRGPVRIKPGRGDPTCSLSCSDKIARWVYAGIQGALLSHLIDGSIKLSSIVIGGGGPYDEDIISHSLIGRSKANGCLPKILQSSKEFSCSADQVKEGKPAPASIIWSKVSDVPLEVAIEGRRQGSTIKKPTKGMLRTCKRELLSSYLALCEEDFSSLTYRGIKDKAEFYQNVCNEFKKNMGSWSVKPLGLEDFSL